MEENLVLNYCNYQSNQEIGYFSFGQELISYSFLNALKRRVDPSDFSSGAVLDIYDVLGYDYVDTLNIRECYVVGLCLSIIASEIQLDAKYKSVDVDCKSNILGVVNEL